MADVSKERQRKAEIGRGREMNSQEGGGSPREAEGGKGRQMQTYNGCRGGDMAEEGRRREQVAEGTTQRHLACTIIDPAFLVPWRWGLLWHERIRETKCRDRCSTFGKYAP